MHWENYKMEMLEKRSRKDVSRQLINPGKYFFLKRAARVVREVNQQRDEDGLSFARKAMM